MIQFRKVSKNYGKVEVLQGMDLSLPSMGSYAILGPNGSGKTTLIKCLLGMVMPDEGDIFFKGNTVLGEYQYRDQIAHVPQTAHFPDNLTAKELIRMIEQIRPGAIRTSQMIDLFGVEQELSKKMSSLSGGNRQKLNLILGLMYDAPVLILDEPSTGLDPLMVRRLKSFLQDEHRRGKLIIITTHMMSFVEEVSDHIIFLLDGRVHYHGTLLDLLAGEQADRLEEAIESIMKPKKALQSC